MNRLVAISGIHLIGLFITAFEIPRGAHGIAEGPVVDGGIFGRIGQDQRIDVAIGLSASRMAPMRPSIMSEGATTSAPARAWLTACLTRVSLVMSFNT